MKLIKHEPGIGYLDSWLWLPKTHVSRIQIEATFTYIGRDSWPIEAWREEPHHFRVPRNYLSPESRAAMPFPFFDARIQSFPTINVKSRAVMDAREPGTTYQSTGCQRLLATQDGILCLKCGAGKTVVALHSAVQLRVPILIVVNDESLSEQWLEEIEEWLDIPLSDVGILGGRSALAKRFEWRKPIVIAQVATLARRVEKDLLPPEMAHHFGVIIPDEAHLIGAPYFNNALTPFHGRRWGLTATPTREDGFDSLLQYTLGNVVYSYLTPDLIPDVWFRQLPTTLNPEDPICRRETHGKDNKFHHGMTYGFFARTNRDKRTDRIETEIKNALSTGRQVLVLTHSKEMTELLGARFPDSGVVNGDVRGKERRRRIRECNPVIAVMTLGKQALNKPSLDTLFIVEPFAKAGILQQTMGRVLRRFSGKKKPVVIFFEDVYIEELKGLCGKLRLLLSKWPLAKGGKIAFKTIKV